MNNKMKKQKLMKGLLVNIKTRKWFLIIQLISISILVYIIFHS